jgi:hypothetical protein
MRPCHVTEGLGFDIIPGMVSTECFPVKLCGSFLQPGSVATWGCARLVGFHLGGSINIHIVAGDTEHGVKPLYLITSWERVL